jgi:hypothetical protein
VLGTARYQFHTSAQVDRLELVGALGTLSFSVFGREPLELRVADQLERIETEQPEHVHLPLVQSIVDELSGAGGRCPSTGQSAERASRGHGPRARRLLWRAARRLLAAARDLARGRPRPARVKRRSS